MAEGLPRRLRYAFMLQVAIASLVIVAGTWVAMVVVRREIAEHAMHEEVAYFWQMRAVDPAHEPPDESRLRGYVATGGDESRLPQELRGLAPGMHTLRRQIVMVDDRAGTRLLLAYPRTEMNMRAAQMVAAPLLLALHALAGSAWFTYRNARRIVAPLDLIARSVRDSGVGIAAHLLETIFERFWQVGADDRRGLGLGLYICRQIVEQHGGHLRAESDGEGRGASMTMWLPDAGPADACPPEGA